MDSLNLNKHISGQFNAELESIRTQVMTMGGMVEQQLSDAITAMHNQDSDLAKRVIEGDKNVNMMEVAIDEACVRIIAKRQPTASDLRLVMVISKTIAELERIGDYIFENIGPVFMGFFEKDLRGRVKGNVHVDPKTGKRL